MSDNEDTIPYEDEDPTVLINESPSDEFCEYMTNSKKELYEFIVLGPKIPESVAAQDTALLYTYMSILSMLGNSIIKIITNPTEFVLEEELQHYSSDTKELVTNTLNYTDKFFKTNSNINKMVYIHHIKNIFNFYPFLQLPYFPK